MSKKALSIRNEQLSKEVQDMPETSDREKENLLRKKRPSCGHAGDKGRGTGISLIAVFTPNLSPVHMLFS